MGIGWVWVSFFITWQVAQTEGDAWVWEHCAGNKQEAGSLFKEKYKGDYENGHGIGSNNLVQAEGSAGVSR